MTPIPFLCTLLLYFSTCKNHISAGIYSSRFSIVGFMKHVDKNIKEVIDENSKTDSFELGKSSSFPFQQAMEETQLLLEFSTISYCHFTKKKSITLRGITYHIGDFWSCYDILVWSNIISSRNIFSCNNSEILKNVLLHNFPFLLSIQKNICVFFLF